MADKLDLVLTSAATISLASRKRRKRPRSCWVRLLVTSGCSIVGPYVKFSRPSIHSRWRRSQIWQ